MGTGSRRLFLRTAEEEDVPLDLDFAGHQRRLEEAAEAELAQLRISLLGAFDTELGCVCGAANITDHAEIPPGTPFDPGPRLTPREERDGFRQRISHEYWCERCGLEYRGQVIELRGYVPREKQG